jgi:HSP20 family molecular chaperone IbpA
VLPRVPGADPRRLTVTVHDGVVTISGRGERRSAVAGLVTAALEVEGVIQVDQHVAYAVDDRYRVAAIWW